MRFCPGCGIEFKDDELQNTINAYIQSISPELKTDGAEYQRRLQHCQNCRFLFGITCSLCGCFVAARAAKKAMHCPNANDLFW